jgi:Flp pilus assembly CpaE family ATPase
VRVCRRSFEATIVNTGGFWSLFQSNLLESCNCIVVTCDHSLAGIKATQELLGYLQQLQVPLARVVVLITRYHKRGVALHDITTTFDPTPVFTLASLGPEACISMDAGQPLQVLEEFDAIAESFMVLAERISEMTGIPLRGTRELAAQMSRRGWFSRIWSR